MKRRFLVLTLLFGVIAKGERIPTDEHELNRFAEAYNLYVLRLKENVVETRLWKRVVSIWQRLTS